MGEGVFRRFLIAKIDGKRETLPLGTKWGAQIHLTITRPISRADESKHSILCQNRTMNF